MQRDLCAGSAAERHRDHAAHALLLASGLAMPDAFKAIAMGALALSLATMVDASALAADGSAQFAPAKHQVGKSTDLSARRHYARAIVPLDDGYYYDRPVAYRPYPYV